MPRADPGDGQRAAPRRWRGGSLTTRILAVNLVALLLLGASLLYLDSYRKQLLAERFQRAGSEAEIAADALAHTPSTAIAPLLAAIGTRQHLRLRLFNASGRLAADSFTLAPPSVSFADPRDDDAYKRTARLLDRVMDTILDTPPVPDYRETAGGPPLPGPKLSPRVPARRRRCASVMQTIARP